MNLTKRQKEILDFIRSYRTEKGISPTQREIRESFGLSSFGTVQKHLKRLEEKGALSRQWNRSRGHRARRSRARSRPVALLGLVAAGRPIEPFPDEESIEVPASLLGKGEHFVLRVRGDSMIEDGIRDGDYVIVARRSAGAERADGRRARARRGDAEALLRRGRARAAPAGQRRDEAAHLRRPRRDRAGRRDRPDAQLLAPPAPAARAGRRRGLGSARRSSAATPC